MYARMGKLLARVYEESLVEPQEEAFTGSREEASCGRMLGIFTWMHERNLQMCACDEASGGCM